MEEFAKCVFDVCIINTWKVRRKKKMFDPFLWQMISGIFWFIMLLNFALLFMGDYTMLGWGCVTVVVYFLVGRHIGAI